MFLLGTATGSALSTLRFSRTDYQSPPPKNLSSELYKHIASFSNLIVFSRYVNATTGRVIRYYEVEIKPFTQQVYKNLKPANLVGYDGISPGPTFRMERGEEAVVRFINHGTMDNSVHLHGSYSQFSLRYL